MLVVFSAYMPICGRWQVFEGEYSNKETCHYHPGVPVFHEGCVVNILNDNIIALNIKISLAKSTALVSMRNQSLMTFRRIAKFHA